MNRTLNTDRCIPLALALMTLGVGTAAHAQNTYQVTVNTSSISSQAGFIDIQFNPGNANALAATITITGFAQKPANALSPTATDTGGASGSLPGTVRINNSTGFNDLFQGITYGSSFSFTGTFSGPALSPTQPTQTGSTFSIALYGSDGATPLLTNNGNGDLFDINVNPNGSTSVFNFSKSGAATVAAAPEPSGLLGLAFGGTGLGLMAWRKRRTA